MKRMVVFEDVGLYLATDQTNWRGLNCEPKSFVLEQCLSEAPLTLLYRCPNGQMLTLDPFSSTEFIVRSFIRLKRECCGVMQETRPETIDRIYFTKPSVTAATIVKSLVPGINSQNLYANVRVCTRSSLEDVSKLSQDACIFVVFEDHKIPLTLYYNNANQSETVLSTGDIPELEITVHKLPPHYLLTELSSEQLSPLTSCFENYLTKIVPMPLSKQLTRDILKSFKLTNESMNLLLQRLYHLGAESDWGVESGVIVDVLIHFLILLQRTLKEIDKEERNLLKDQQQLFGLLVGILVVACKLSNDFGAIVDNNEFAMRSDDDWLDLKCVNALERFVLKRNRFCFTFTENELNGVVGRLSDHHKKHSKLRGSRYQLWFRSASQLSKTSNEASVKPAQVVKNKK